MACITPDYGVTKIDNDRFQELTRVEAALCGIITVLESNKITTDILDRVDWQEAGVKRHQIEEWWATHKAKDELRRIKEQEEADRRRKIDEARKKLTKEERELLGIK